MRILTMLAVYILLEILATIGNCKYVYNLRSF